MAIEPHHVRASTIDSTYEYFKLRFKKKPWKDKQETWSNLVKSIILL